MSDMTFDTGAHRLLEELETRHDQLLKELDELNARIEAVLSQYTQVNAQLTPSVPSTTTDSTTTDSSNAKIVLDSDDGLEDDEE